MPQQAAGSGKAISSQFNFTCVRLGSSSETTFGSEVRISGGSCLIFLVFDFISSDTIGYMKKRNSRPHPAPLVGFVGLYFVSHGHQGLYRFGTLARYSPPSSSRSLWWFFGTLRYQSSFEVAGHQGRPPAADLFSLRTSALRQKIPEMLR